MNETLTNLDSPPVRDNDLPGLRLALDKEAARKEFKRRFPDLSLGGKLKLRRIRLIRHKPGRRCIAEYDLAIERPGTSRQKVTLIGKTRSHRSGNEAFRLQKALWGAGFDSQSKDNISVPEPIGVITPFKMWFQRKVKGLTAEELLRESGGVALAKRVARAIHKLHQAGIPTTKSHTLEDELQILRNCLAQVALIHPEWRQRLESLMRACEKFAKVTPLRGTCGIHRDFYPAQMIVEKERLWLLDFDLYCLGDPSLDPGNFIGHITEQSLRERGRPDALADVENALEEEFVLLSGERTRPALKLYRDLTLVRHIFISTKSPERAHLTEALLNLCEQRLLDRQASR